MTHPSSIDIPPITDNGPDLDLSREVHPDTLSGIQDAAATVINAAAEGGLFNSGEQIGVEGGVLTTSEDVKTHIAGFASNGVPVFESPKTRTVEFVTDRRGTDHKSAYSTHRIEAVDNEITGRTDHTVTNVLQTDTVRPAISSGQGSLKLAHPNVSSRERGLTVSGMERPEIATEHTRTHVIDRNGAEENKTAETTSSGEASRLIIDGIEYSAAPVPQSSTESETMPHNPDSRVREAAGQALDQINRAVTDASQS